MTYVRVGRQGLKTYGRRKFQRRMAGHRRTLGEQRIKYMRGARRYPQVVTPIVVGVTKRGRMAGQVIELKFHDLDINDAAIATNGTILEDSCNEIPQGVTESQRIGRKCTIRMINWRFQITKSAATASSATTDIVRVVLYLDKQANGATAAITDILETDDFQSFNQLSNKSRFRTLMDRVYDMNNSSGGGDGTTEDYGGYTLNDSFYKKVNIPIEFDATSGLMATIRSNNIGVLILSQAGRCTFESKMRLRFSDS